MRISKLVKEFGCTSATIQHYERLGLLPEPARTSGNFRIYSQVHVELLGFIRRCRTNDIPLNDIKQFITMIGQATVESAKSELVERHICDLRDKINAMQYLLIQLDSIRLNGRLDLRT